MTEWLRCWTWNPMGFPRAGSNPAHSVLELTSYMSLSAFYLLSGQVGPQSKAAYSQRYSKVISQVIQVATPDYYFQSRSKFLQLWGWFVKKPKNSCDDRVVKVLDLKSNGVSPRRFEPCSQRSRADIIYRMSLAAIYLLSGQVGPQSKAAYIIPTLSNLFR